MKTITVCDPPMCCTTGVCGPEVDPKLTRFASDLDRLMTRGEQVRRVDMAQEPGRFLGSRTIKALLDDSDGDDLPAIVVSDEVVADGRYPESPLARHALLPWYSLPPASCLGPRPHRPKRRRAAPLQD